MNVKRGVLITCLGLCILTVLQFKRFVHYDVAKAITKAKSQQETDHTGIITRIQRASYAFPNLTAHISSRGPIDVTRTKKLAETASRMLTQSWWRGQSCRCEHLIKDFILGTSPGVQTHVYWTEAFFTRTVISIAYPGFTKESREPFKISLLTQISSNRIEMLDLIAARWHDPINIAIYIKPRDIIKGYNKINEWLLRSKRKNVVVHLVVAEGELYPVNWLRNLVMHNSSTEYIFLVDGDFIPSVNLERQLKQTFQSLAKENTDSLDNTVVIVPAFEITDAKVTGIPRDKPELLKLISKKKADVFHRAKYPDGHSIWNYDKWKHMKERYNLYHVKTCSDRAEPYMAMKHSQSPYLPEILLERGKNKVAYFFELCMSNNRFAVLPNEYIIHKMHPVSNRVWDDTVGMCVRDAYDVFKKHISDQYGKSYKISVWERYDSLKKILSCVLGDFIFLLFVFLCVFVPITVLIYCCIYRRCKIAK